MTRQEAYDRNVARFKPGQVWADEAGKSIWRIVEGPVNHPLYLLDEDGNGADVDRLALRVTHLPERPEPDGGCWIDESSFPYYRLMVDVEAPRGKAPNRLAELIEARGVKLVHVGAAVDKDQSTVYRWMKGLSKIDDDQKAALAEYFGVTRSYLMGWDQEEAA